jgi:L-seryl-tRNA(Ser) seleniumtransferase
MTSLRDLPSIDTLLQSGEALIAQHGRDQTLFALRHVVEEARQAVVGGAAVPEATVLVAQAADMLNREARPTLRPVVNATGVIIHTNLGRAPLSDAALAAVGAMSGYSTLEYDLEPGVRGKRDRHIERLLTQVTGAEAGMVVNNNASGVLLALSALAHDREAIISRGQLVEIGGSFRVPDVMAQSGARMVEVGTTNRTHLRDYAHAITEQTAVIMRVHPSNYRVVGFTTIPALRELTELARQHTLIVLDDIGSGALLDTAQFGLAHEPTPQESLTDGADLVLFSGDKLLGGPQAGIIVGHAELITLLKQHPLARAIRADKLALAALSATLDHYRRGDALEQVPVWRMISLTLDAIRTRAELWAAEVGGEVIASESTVGGGSLPGETLPTWVLAPDVAQPNAAAALLRAHDPPVITRVAQDRLLLDPRTVLPGQDEIVLAALRTLKE